MTPELWATWLGPAAVGALAVVLWWRLNKQDSETAQIKGLLTTELRLFDVRLSVVERELGIQKRL